MFETARGQRVGAARTRQQQVGTAATDAALQRAHLQAAEERKGARDCADPARAKFSRDALVRANRRTGLPARSPAENGRQEMKSSGRMLRPPLVRRIVSDEKESPIIVECLKYFSYAVCVVEDRKLDSVADHSRY